jgi:prolyl-tRNA editing enzyme YbaK/EbsC (Cys-tRNA(Pro) deacylase)
MSVESVREFLSAHAPDIEIIELPSSTATVELAAQGHGVAPAQIAKTLSLRIKGRTLLVVACGVARLNNKKVKAVLGGKASMLSAHEVAALTGHPVGGVCPFGLASPLPIYCDLSLKAFDEVLPAAGSTNAALRINPERMAKLVNAQWIDVCDVPRETTTPAGLERGGAAS